MTRPIAFLRLSVVLLAMGCAGAAADEKSHGITWMLDGAPPKFIPDGPLRGTGYGEQQVAFLTRHLPQFDQRLEAVTPARLWHEMQTGQGICSIDIADLPEREQWAVFTRHRTTVPSYRVLVSRERLSEFAAFRGADGKIDLDRLAASDRFTGIFVATRHYTPQVNDFIVSPTRKAHLETTRDAAKIFEMVAGRRGDFSFGTVTEMNYFNAVNAASPPGGKPWPPLTMLPIKGAGEQVHGHIACSRDPLGRQMVEAIDRLFDDEATWNEYLVPLRRWLDDVPVPAR